MVGMLEAIKERYDSFIFLMKFYSAPARNHFAKVLCEKLGRVCCSGSNSFHGIQCNSGINSRGIRNIKALVYILARL
jgi:hypothetical protein